MPEPNRREFDLALELVTPPVPESTYRYVTGATYSGDDGAQHRYDAYLPTTVADRPPPVVIFVHGDGPPDFLREPRLWGQYRSWGKLVAANGMAAITFDHGSTEGRTRIQAVLNEIGALLATVERDADTLGLDASPHRRLVGFGGRAVRLRGGAGSSIGALPGRLLWTDGPPHR